KEHIAEFDVEIDPQLTIAVQRSAEAFKRMLVEDAILPETPAPITAQPMVSSPITFTAEVALKKVHAILVLDRSGSFAATHTCELMKAAATRFARLFVPGRDSLGVVSFGATVQSLPLAADFFERVPDYIDGLSCVGGTNTSEAVEVARQELTRSYDSDAVNT